MTLRASPCVTWWDTPAKIALPLALLLSCSNRTESESLADTSTLEPLPRYWLVSTRLLDAPDGRETRHIDGPALVELRPDGRVRSVERSPDAFEGYVPRVVLREPGETAGLMLYAQQQAELHWQSPTGPVFGRLYPGAFVSVVPGASEYALVGSLGFHFLQLDAPLLGFVLRRALGPNQVALTPPTRHPGGLALLSGGEIPLYVHRSKELMPSLVTRRCSPFWLDEDGLVSQYHAGVEIRAEQENLAGAVFAGSRDNYSQSCPAPVVSRDGANLLLQATDQYGERTAEPVAEIPPHFVPVHIPDPDPIVNLINRGGSIYWLAERCWPAADCDCPFHEYCGWRPVCERWQFEPAQEVHNQDAAVLEARLVASEKVYLKEGGPPIRPYFRATYRLSSVREPASLGLSRGCPFNWMTPIGYAYRLLDAANGVLFMMGEQMPKHPVAFDPRDTERWFLSRSACEKARWRAIVAINRDLTLAPYLGFRTGPIDPPDVARHVAR